MTDPCTIIIGALDFLPALKERASSINGEVIAFADAEALRALEAIHKRKPSVVALHRLFAVSPRGAALINRIKADPSLRLLEIRVLEHNSDYTRVIPRPAAPGCPPSFVKSGGFVPGGLSPKVCFCSSPSARYCARSALTCRFDDDSSR